MRRAVAFWGQCPHRPLTVRAFIPDPCPYPYPGGSSLAEGVIADKEGNVYGADFLGTVRKFNQR